GLVWPHALARKLADEVHEVLRRVALDVVLAAGPGLHERGEVEHVLAADVPLVGPRVNGDALRARLQAQLGRARDAGNAQVARVAHQGDLVDVDGQGGAVVHKACRSIMSWRVRRSGLPQWYCSRARNCGL